MINQQLNWWQYKFEIHITLSSNNVLPVKFYRKNNMKKLGAEYYSENACQKETNCKILQLTRYV